jgi:hypothetical protein
MCPLRTKDCFLSIFFDWNDSQQEPMQDHQKKEDCFNGSETFVG